MAEPAGLIMVVGQSLGEAGVTVGIPTGNTKNRHRLAAEALEAGRSSK